MPDTKPDPHFGEESDEQPTYGEKVPPPSQDDDAEESADGDLGPDATPTA